MNIFQHHWEPTTERVQHGGVKEALAGPSVGGHEVGWSPGRGSPETGAPRGRGLYAGFMGSGCSLRMEGGGGGGGFLFYQPHRIYEMWLTTFSGT